MFQLLKKQLKSEHGKGWSVLAMRGKVQLTLWVDENAGWITLEIRYGPELITSPFM